MTDQKSEAFEKVSTTIDFPAAEEKILRLWKERSIFDKSLAPRADSKGTFVFYEGPPTANGLPHNGHVLTRVIKDLFPRYRTMRGYEVPRKAGWDTHGLPVEVEVEKELRIHGKAEIEKHGVEPFVARCIESVFRYTTEWERLTERIGFWVDLKDAYVTYHRSYVESVWWALANLHQKGLLYRGHKVVWWWAQGGTALSSAEVGLGYKTVDDPSVYVAFPLAGDPATSLLVWTTTPWTLPSNMYAAVKADVDYVVVEDEGKKLIVAAALREALEKKLKRALPVLSTKKGAELVGTRYSPPFDLYAKEATSDPHLAEKAYTVIAADFVTLDSGTGIVHIAPAFGEDDFNAHRKLYPAEVHITPFCAVNPDGTFVPELSRWAGRWVKDADKEIQHDLKERGLLLFAELYRHDYPFCWRSDDDPLIQYARPAWYIQTTAKIDRAIANNQAINWLPEHIKDGRFGDFLDHNVDWALSRERYWGTPLPLWENQKTGAIEAISSLQELADKPGSNVGEVEGDLAKFAPHLRRDLIVHKPWIDKIRYGSDETGWFVRVPEVIDCWFDSGCMPFAQWGFPHAPDSKERFARAFPADFISEAIDQTRGWFYSLLMISTLVFDEETMKAHGLSPRPFPHPYKTCIVLGHVGDKEGKKESKSKGNYTPPEVILERVRMEFAVVDDEQAGLKSEPGTALVAREDMEGLDLGEGAKIVVYVGQGEAKRELVLRAGKKLPRRVVLLAPADREALGASVHPKGLDVKPVEVPRIPQHERVFVEDPSTPAPGADGFRWFFYASSPPWTNTRHSLSNVRALQKDFQVKLRNVYSFFTIYANLDGWSPATGNATKGATTIRELLAHSPGYRPASVRANVLDRWILSELALTVRDVTVHLDAYRVYDAAQRLVELTDAISNWYVRRSRERFWAPWSKETEADKRDVYLTLYEVLTTLAQTAAPFTPFLAEEMWQNLVRRPFPGEAESVHLCAFPTPDPLAIDERLSEEMRVVRELVSIGLQVRTNAKLKVRQPLSSADVVLARRELAPRLEQYRPLILEELNVHELRFLEAGQEGSEVRYKLKPNFRALGPKLGKKVQLAKQLLEKADAAAMRVEMAEKGSIALDLDGEQVALGPEEIEVAVEAAPGFAAAGARVGVVVLHTELDARLVDEGLAREVLSRVQAVRKDLELGYAERIRLALGGSERHRRGGPAGSKTIADEALAVELVVGEPTFDVAERREAAFDDESLTIALGRA